MKIREMTMLDVDTVICLIDRAMNEEAAQWAVTTFDRHFSAQRAGIDDGRCYFVFEQDQRIVGISGLHCYEWGPPKNTWLGWFALHPQLHGKGLGRQMLLDTEQEAIGRGYEKLLIETYDTPVFAKAISFYQHAGYSKVGAIEQYLPDGSKMLVYMKRL